MAPSKRPTGLQRLKSKEILFSLWKQKFAQILLSWSGFPIYYLLKTRLMLPDIYRLKASNWSQRKRKGGSLTIWAWKRSTKILHRFKNISWTALWWWLPFQLRVCKQIWRLTKFSTPFDGSDERNKCAFITFTNKVF